MRPEALAEDASESTLALRFHEGDRGAFAALARRYMERAFYFALGIVGDVDDARDIAQEAFIRAYDRRRGYDPARAFLPWFYAIVRNLCLDRLRGPQRRTVRVDRVPFLADAHEGAEERLEREDARDRVWRAIRALRPKHREIIVLRHFEDLSYREIGEILGESRGTVMSRLFQARSDLKRRLGPFLDEIGWEVSGP